MKVILFISIYLFVKKVVEKILSKNIQKKLLI